MTTKPKNGLPVSSLRYRLCLYRGVDDGRNPMKLSWIRKLIQRKKEKTVSDEQRREILAKIERNSRELFRRLRDK